MKCNYTQRKLTRNQKLILLALKHGGWWSDFASLLQSNNRWYMGAASMALPCTIARLLHHKHKGERGCKTNTVVTRMTRQWITRRKRLNKETGRRQYWYTLTKQGREALAPLLTEVAKQFEQDYRPDSTIPEDFYQ